MSQVIAALDNTSAARPVVSAALGLGGKTFEAFIEQRRKELPPFLKRALRP